jgi:methyl-accepting chemotaxis protein
LVKVVENVQKSGDLSLRNQNRSSDEIGLISDAFNRFLDSLHIKTEIARNVAKGKLSTEVTLLSTQDSLGESLQIMQKSLLAKEKAINEISLGNVDFELEVQSSEDQLSITINKFISDMSAIAKQADIIAGGDYSVSIKARSEKDTLMLSLSRMTDTLQENLEKSDQENWYKTGQNIINNKVRGNLTELLLAQRVIATLCSHMQLHCGVYYQHDVENDSLAYLKLCL